MSSDTPRSPIPMPKVILSGPIGTGKTHSLRTLLDADPNITLFVLGTDPGIEVLYDLIGTGRFHYKYIAPLAADWEDMLESGRLINQLSIEGLSKLAGIKKEKYTQWLQVMSCHAKFVCDCHQHDWGAVDHWPVGRIFVHDGLSGLNQMAMDLQVGSKPTKNQGDWGIAMDNEERLINKCATALRTMYVLCAHLDRERNEITGGEYITIGALGRKLGPKLPRNFSDMIITRREGTRFLWSTIEYNTDTKARSLPWADKQDPNFKVIIDTFKQRGGVIEERVSNMQIDAGASSPA